MRVATSETGAACNSFFADLVAGGLTGVRMVTSDAHAGLVKAIAAHLLGAAWQRCRTHYAANLVSICPKGGWPAVKAMLHSVYDQPAAVAAPTASESSPLARGSSDSLARSWPNRPTNGPKAAAISDSTSWLAAA